MYEPEANSIRIFIVTQQYVCYRISRAYRANIASPCMHNNRVKISRKIGSSISGMLRLPCIPTLNIPPFLSAAICRICRTFVQHRAIRDSRIDCAEYDWYSTVAITTNDKSDIRGTSRGCILQFVSETAVVQERKSDRILRRRNLNQPSLQVPFAALFNLLFNLERRCTSA